MKVIKWLKENVFYIRNWKREIKKEIKYEKKGKKLEYLKKWYFKKTGLILNIENPTTFTEKQQVIKLNNDTKIKTFCTDKYLVRSFIERVIGADYLIPIVSINGKDKFTNAFEIGFDDLPNSFVIQCNHGAHMTHVVKDKKKLGKKGFRKLQKRLNRELKVNYAYCHGYEMQYKNIQPCIFITEFISSSGDLPDYKFFCFNGEMKYFSIDTDRFNNHKRTIYDAEYQIAEFQCPQYEMVDIKIESELLDRMKMIVYSLADYFDFVRVDLYAAGDKIYFGELTFSSASGIAILTPENSNLNMSNYIDLTKMGKAKKNFYEEI